MIRVAVTVTPKYKIVIKLQKLYFIVLNSTFSVDERFGKTARRSRVPTSFVVSSICSVI